MSTPTGKATRRPYHHGDLRPSLVRSARELLRKGGLPAVTLRAVAQRSGVSVAAPYRHFADKSALLTAALADALGELREALESSVDPDPLARLHALGHRFVDLAVAEPELVALLAASDLGPAADPELVAAVQETFGSFAVAIDDAVASGVVEVESTRTALLTMRCLIQGLAGLIANGAVPAEAAHRTAERVMTMVDRGLLARGPIESAAGQITGWPAEGADHASGMPDAVAPRGRRGAQHPPSSRPARAGQ